MLSNKSLEPLDLKCAYISCVVRNPNAMPILGEQHKRLRCYVGEDADGDRIYMPGVTSYLDATGNNPALYSWLAKQNEKVNSGGKADTSGRERGSLIHACIENYINDGEVPSVESLNGSTYSYWESAYRYLTANNIPKRTLVIEACVQDTVNAIGGRVDWVGFNERDQLTLMDWKTSSRVKRIDEITDYIYQVAIYRVLFNSTYREQLDAIKPGLKIDECVIVPIVGKLEPDPFTIHENELHRVYSSFMNNRYKKFWENVEFDMDSIEFD